MLVVTLINESNKVDEPLMVIIWVHIPGSALLNVMNLALNPL